MKKEKGKKNTAITGLGTADEGLTALASLNQLAFATCTLARWLG